MKFRITGVLLICFSIIILGSCQIMNENKGEKEIPGSEVPDPSNNNEEQDDSTDTDDIKDNNKDYADGDKSEATTISFFVSLIGLADQEVVNRIGKGIKSQENGSDSVVTREYPFNLQNNSLTAIVSYDNKGFVQGVYSFLPDTEKEKWEAYLSDELGKPTRVESGKLNIEDGNYITYILWMVEERIVTLYGSHGSLSIQIE